MSIRRLSEAVANQIAAGEVVERPASVLKELVENALDAGAGRIQVELDAGGKDLIRVEDDGCGIAAGEIELAFERHATSKLTAIGDLPGIVSLGFRGEALPAIASVSRTVLTTLPASDTSGTRIALEGGKVVALDRVAFSRGTTVEVRNLFFNVPARLKFLRATAAEATAAGAMLTRIVLAHHQVYFRLVRDGKLVFACPATADRRERIGQLFGHERAGRLIAAAGNDGGLGLEALLEPPDRHAPTRGEQHCFVNRRPIADRALQQALTQAYEGLLPEGRFPSAFVFLSAAPGLVDVNVHPAKSEVRFADRRAAPALVRSSLRSALVAAGFVPALRVAPHPESIHEAASPYLGAPAAASAPVRVYHLAAPGRATATAEAAAPAALAVTGASEVALDWCRPPQGAVLAAPGRRILGQHRATFIVVGDERGLILIDQHTAHERVLFERLQKGGAATASQPLLLPIVVEIPRLLALTPGEAVAELARAGIEAFREVMGERALAVRSLPEAAGKAPAARLIGGCLESIARGEDTDLGRRHDRVLATVACHAAVTVNTALDMAKMEWIVGELFDCADPYVCPHGRAVLLRLDDDTIAKSFGRYW